MDQQPLFQSPFANITLNPDGTVKRPPIPRSPANQDPNGTSSVLSKDVVLDPKKKTWIRLYVPRTAAPDDHNKLPLILYYHGGGFVFCNADTTVFDVFCQGLAKNIGAMVISLDYRLAPDHRLPAAFEDAVDGFYWIQNTEDEWVKSYADLNNIFLCGSSAGGNIAYYAGFHLSSKANEEELNKLKVGGLILHQPFFSGKKRTESEEKLADNWLLPLRGIDELFELSLPEGSDRDHEYCNPLGSWKIVESMKGLGWRVLVTGSSGDPLADAGMEFAKMLEREGVKTVKYWGDGYHAVEVFEPSKSAPLFDAIKNFMTTMMST